MTEWPYFGHTLALSAAIIWAVAVILFKKSGESVHPVALNLFKNILASLLLVPTIWLAGGSLTYPASFTDYLLLLLSGALGIGLADTLFFRSLNLLGAGMSAIVDCLYSPAMIGLSMLWLGERLTTWQALGSVLVLSAVMTAISRKGRAHIPKRDLWLGVLWGGLAMLSMAVGVVIIKDILDRTPLLWATQTRLYGGIAVLALLLVLHPRRRTIVSTLRGRLAWGYTISGSLLGGYVSMIIWLAGMKYTLVSVAAALNQTTTIFIFVFALFFLREPLNRQRVVGMILGVAGSLLVTFG